MIIGGIYRSYKVDNLSAYKAKRFFYYFPPYLSNVLKLTCF